MKVGVVMEDEKGLEGNVCAHFGHCQFFLLADIDTEGKKIINTQIVPNNTIHGSGGCGAVDEILKYRVTHVLAGGMGMGAQLKLANAGVQIFGFDGTVKQGILKLMNNALVGIEACKEHGHHEGGCHH